MPSLKKEERHQIFPPTQAHHFFMHILLKIAKGLLYFLLAIILLLVVAGFFADSIVKNLLENRVGKLDSGQYTLELGEVDVSVIKGNIVLEEVDFSTASTDTLISPVIMAKADRLAVKGFDWLQYLTQQELILSQLELENLRLQLKASRKDSISQSDKPFRLEQLDIYPAINQKLDKIFLNNLSFNKISFELINISSGDTLQFDAEKLGLNSEDILIEANRLITSERAFYAESIDLDGRAMEIKRSGNKAWEASMETLMLTTQEDRLKTLMGGMEYLSRNPASDTLLYARLDSLEAGGLDLNQLQESGAFYWNKVVLDGVQIVKKKEEDEKKKKDEAVAATGPRFPIGDFNLAEQLPPFIEVAGVEELIISQVNYRAPGEVFIKDFDLKAGEVVIGKEKAFADGRFLHTTSLSANLGKLVAEVGQPSHQLVLKGIELQAENGSASVSLEQIVIDPEERSAGNAWVDADIAALKVAGIQYGKLTEGELLIDSIGIKDPEVIVYIPESGSDKKKSSQAPDLYPLIDGFLEVLRIGELAVINGDVRVKGIGGGAEGAAFPVVYIQMDDLLISDGTAFTEERIFHALNTSIFLKNIYYLFPNEVYVLQLETLKASTAEEFLKTEKISFTYNNNYKKILDGPKSNVVYKVRNEEFVVNGLDYEKLVTGEGLFAQQIMADEINFYSLKDFNKPEALSVKPMPQKALKTMSFPLNIRELTVSDADVVYEEQKKGVDTSGVIKFTDISAKVRNITNIHPLLLKNSEMPVVADGKIMGEGNFETELVFYMLSDRNKVKVTGSLDTMDITSLNRIARYNSRVALESGIIYRAEWDFIADVEQSQGTMLMRYDNLDLQLSSGDSPDTTGVLKDIASFLGNKLLIESDRAEDKEDKPEKVDFKQERNKEKNFLNYYWKSLLAGLKELILPF